MTYSPNPLDGLMANNYFVSSPWKQYPDSNDWPMPNVGTFSGIITINNLPSSNLLSINKAENGFIVAFEAKTYVFNEFNKLSEFLADKLKGEK